jgi:hypothetical protein
MGHNRSPRENAPMRNVVMTAIWAAVVTGLVAVSLACSSGEDAGSGASDETPFVTIDDGGGEEGTEVPGGDSESGESPDGDDPTVDDDWVPSEVDACALLTADEVVLAIGVPVDEGEPFESPPFYDCEWSGEGGGINLSVFGAERVEVESYFEIGHEADERVDDVGEEAFWDDERAIIEVLSGNYSVSVSSVGSAALSLEAAANLADIAISRLP